MAENMTQGYDLVFEMNEQVLNDLLPAEPFPPWRVEGVEIPVGPFTLGLDYDVFFPVDPGGSVLELDPDIDDGIAINTRFSMELSNLSVTPELPVPLPERIAINGTVRVLHAVSAYSDDLGRRCLGMDFSTLPLDRVQVDITDSSGLPLPEGGTEQLLEQALHRMLRDGVGRLSVFCLMLAEDSGPLVPESFDVRVVGTQCAALLFSTTDSTVGHAAAFNHCHIPEGSDTAVIISGQTLLMHLVCPGVINGLGLEGTVDELFSYSAGQASLRAATSLDHLVDHSLVDAIRLTGMDITIGEGSMTAQATVSIEGFGYRASARLDAAVNLSVDDDGVLIVDYSYDVADVDLFVYPWVWILIALGIAVVPVVGGIIAIVLPLLPFIVEPIAEALASYFLGADGRIDLVPPIPVEIDSVFLDDLLLGGQAAVAPSGAARGPSVWLDSEIEASDRSSSRTTTREIAGAVYETRTTVSVAHEVALRAETERMVHPVTFQWWLNGAAIAGEGHLDVGSVSVGYQVDHDRARLSLEMGDSLDAPMSVRAIAADGVICEDDEQVRVEGSVEIRGFTGVELLEGPSVLALLQALESPAAEALDLPVGPYIDDTPTWERLVSQSRVPALSMLVAEQRGALREGTGQDVPW